MGTFGSVDREREINLSVFPCGYSYRFGSFSTTFPCGYDRHHNIVEIAVPKVQEIFPVQHRFSPEYVSHGFHVDRTIRVGLFEAKERVRSGIFVGWIIFQKRRR